MRRGLTPGDFNENRRDEARMPCLRTIDLLPCVAAKDWKFIPGELRDCSLHGLAVLVPQPFDPGQQFLVKLRIDGGVKLLLYTVQNCVPWERSHYRVGARFSGFAAESFHDNLDAVLDALVRGK